MVVVFCIERNATTGFAAENKHLQFTHFLDNVSTGANGFDGANGLSDRSEVIFIRNVKPRQDSTYYHQKACLLYTSPSPRDATLSRMPSSA